MASKKQPVIEFDTSFITAYLEQESFKVEDIQSDVKKMFQKDMTVDEINKILEDFSEKQEKVSEKQEKNDTKSEEIKEKSRSSFMDGIVSFYESEAGQYIQSGFEHISGTVSSHFNEVLGDMKTDILDPIMGVMSSALGFLMGDKGIDIAEDSNNTLKDIDDKLQDQLNSDKQDSLQDARGSKKNGIGKIFDTIKKGLMFSLMGLSVLIGGVIGYIVKPFEVLAKIGLAVGKIFKGGKNFAFVEKITKFFGMMGKGSKLAKAFGYGFRVIGSTVQWLFAIFDFMSGYINSKEKTVIGKIKDGVTKALLGFLDIPIRLIGIAMETAFGIDPTDQITEFITNSVSEIFVMLTENFNKLKEIFNSLFEGDFEGAWKSTIEYMIDIPTRILAYFTNLFLDFIGAESQDSEGMIRTQLSEMLDSVISFFRKIFDTVTSVLNSAKDFILDLVPDWAKDSISSRIDSVKEVTGKGLDWWDHTDFKGETRKLLGLKEKSPETIKREATKSALQQAVKQREKRKVEAEKERIRIQKQITKELQTNNRNIVESQKSMSNSVTEAVNNASVVSSNNNNQSIEPPADIESIGLLFLNKTWGLG